MSYFTNTPFRPDVVLINEYPRSSAQLLTVYSTVCNGARFFAFHFVTEANPDHVYVLVQTWYGDQPIRLDQYQALKLGGEALWKLNMIDEDLASWIDTDYRCFYPWLFPLNEEGGDQ